MLLRDPLRRHAPRTVRRLRAAGLNRLVMLTGDRAEPAREVATVLGLDEVYAEQSPADKVAAVRAERDRAVTVMVGDGINDAPALAAATVGVAMGARGATASSEAADIVLTTDRLDRLADAMDIARWSRRIAVQSAVVGMSVVADGHGDRRAGLAAARGGRAAAGGHRRRGDPQRAARTARQPGRRGRTVRRTPKQLLRRFAAEHDELRDTLGAAARRRRPSGRRRRPSGAGGVGRAHSVPHRADPAARTAPRKPSSTRRWPRPLGSGEATATMSRTHAEIQRLSDRIGTHLALAQTAGAIQPDQVDDLLACLYGLYTLAAAALRAGGGELLHPHRGRTRDHPNGTSARATRHRAHAVACRHGTRGRRTALNRASVVATAAWLSRNRVRAETIAGRRRDAVHPRLAMHLNKSRERRTRSGARPFGGTALATRWMINMPSRHAGERKRLPSTDPQGSVPERRV